MNNVQPRRRYAGGVEGARKRNHIVSFTVAPSTDEPVRVSSAVQASLEAKARGQQPLVRALQVTGQRR